ncbi:MAG: glutamate--tRNA ligase, partial [Planctomycetia bacterium]
MTVRTRFAPSPTGYLHIGGVRTALFNWLLAKRHGGQFLLRIDDTDAGRNIDEAVGPILDGFRWLGMQWDEGPEVGGPYAPYFQSQRRPFHEAALKKLIEAGAAYPCLANTADVDRLRDAARTAKLPFVYRSPTRDLPPDEALAIYEEKKPALRFKVPLGKTTVLNDHVRGKVEWQTDLLGDFTISRVGGDPLYNLASIVDDVDMKITHIIRAEEHLANTHPQLLIAQALGAALPE